MIGLGRWLRAAGYDTAIVNHGAGDEALVRVAVAEERVLLTCDRPLAARTELAGRVLVLAPEGLDAAAAELRARLDIDWLHAPFTRCLLDNAELRSAGSADLARVPAPAHAGPGPFTVCPACARVFWPGSHVRPMRARLERWKRA